MKKIILASKSPRRRQLLTDAGFDFVLKTKEVDESFSDTMALEEVPGHLADRKAEAFREELKKGEILLAADTIVIKEGVIYEKPKDAADAFRMLNELQGKKHQVYTGFCLLSLDKKTVFTEKTDVFMKPMTAEDINYYVDNYKPFDKAGSYGIQDWLGLNKIEKVEGCFYNVVGLPVSRVYEELEKF